MKLNSKKNELISKDSGLAYPIVDGIPILIKEKARKLGSPYDCILPVGGGKDSHYQAHVLTQEFKIRPLLVTYNHGYNTKIGIRNLTNIVEKFGLDMLRFTTNPKSAKKLSKYMLKKVGDEQGRNIPANCGQGHWKFP